MGMMIALVLRDQRRSLMSLKNVHYGYPLLALFIAYGAAVMTHLNHNAINTAIYSAFAASCFNAFFGWIILVRQQGFESERISLSII